MISCALLAACTSVFFSLTSPASLDMPSASMYSCHTRSFVFCCQFAGIENLMTAVVDTVPSLRTKKWLVSGVLCAILYIAGFSMCTKVTNHIS